MLLEWMRDLKFFDLHCDTLYEAVTKSKNLYENDLHVSLKKADVYNPYIGCFAVWIPDDIKGENGKALKLFNDAVNLLNNQVKLYGNYAKILKNKEDLIDLKNNKIRKSGIILTVEGSRILGKDINNVKYLYDKGVRMMTLTWNGHCEVGDGADVIKPQGLTEFGKKTIKEMEKINMIVDVSHAGEKLFYDVAENADLPFVATHSNSKSICNHRRNLTDEQFEILKNRRGLVGITFCKDFLSEKADTDFSDIQKHVEHFLELGGENVISFGSDFDGAVMPKNIVGIESMEKLYEYFLTVNYSEELLQKIFFDNAYNFMLKHIR